MTRFTKTLSGLLFLSSAAIGSSANAQQIFYEFTSGPGGDGFNWPASPTGLLEGNSFDTPDGLYLYNDIGNNIFFDQQYQVVGNGSRISGDALWGNPLDFGGGYFSLDFYNLNGGGVQEVDFDFAWSEAGVPAVTDFLSFYVYDSDGRSAYGGWTLSDSFTGFGGGTGYEDHISLDASMFIDDDQNVDGGAFIDISYIDIFVDEITYGGNSSEFALDNLATDGAGGPGLDPANSEVVLNGFNVQTNRLQGSFDAILDFIEVENLGTGGTTYSVTLDPTSAPEFLLESPATNAVINGGEFIPNGTGPITRLPASTISGTYVADYTLINDLNPLDPDDSTTYTVRVLDAPSTTDDSGPTVQAHLDPNIFIANAAAGPHAGALRAGVDVTARTVTGAGFSIDGLDVGDVADAGETENATVNFDRYGRVNGTYLGTFSVDLQMDDPNFSFLNGKDPLPSINWNLNYDLGTISNDSIAVNASDPLGPGLVGVNDAGTAATLLDGISSKSQTVSMALTTDPGVNADLAGTPVDLDFSGVGVQELYVLQLTYLDGNIPSGITESQMQVLFYDTLTGDWELAVDGNTAGTPTFFNGSYTDYLAGPGGGIFDAGDLGAYGIDTTNNHAWAVLDHASLFGVGVLTTTLVGDLDGDGFVGINDLNIVLANWNQNVPPANPLADPSGDGFVGIDDLNAVLGNWNAGTPPSSNAVPEPASVVLLAAGALGLTRRYRR